MKTAAMINNFEHMGVLQASYADFAEKEVHVLWDNILNFRKAMSTAQMYPKLVFVDGAPTKELLAFSVLDTQAKAVINAAWNLGITSAPLLDAKRQTDEAFKDVAKSITLKMQAL